MEGFLGGINWSFPTWDLFIYIFFVASIIFYGLVLGRDRILVILFSIYISLAVASNLPYINDTFAKKFGFGPVFVMKLFVFLLFVVGLYLLFSKMGLLSSFSENASLFHIIIFSVLHVGLLISIVLSFVPQESLGLSDFTKTLFVADFSKFLWIVAPLVAMFLVRREREDKED